MKWIRTRWGSMCDLIERFIQNKHVSHLFGFNYVQFDYIHFIQAVNKFCLVADNTSKVPKLRGSRKYADYAISEEEWKMLELIHEVLKVKSFQVFLFILMIYQEPRDAQASFSSESQPTVWRTIPTLEALQDRWETFASMPKFYKLKNSIEKGLEKMKKYYRFLDQNNVAFICLGMCI